MSKFKILGCRCKSAYCPDCGVSYWAKVREKVRPGLHLFRQPALLTLTIDRSKYDSGEQAYDVVKEEAYIPRFLRALKFDKAFSILAFHQSTEGHPDGNEWPHWHILVDLKDCGGWVNLEKGWSLWRDKWGLGGFDLPTHKLYGSSGRALNYILGYMQHQSGTVAQWLLDRSRSPRSYEFYGSLAKELRLSEGKVEPIEDFDEDIYYDGCFDDDNDDVPVFASDLELDSQSVSVKDRVESCYGSSLVLLETDSGRLKYIGSLPGINPGALAILGKTSGNPDISVGHVKSQYHDGARIEVDFHFVGTIKQGFEELRLMARQVHSIRRGAG